MFLLVGNLKSLRAMLALLVLATCASVGRGQVLTEWSKESASSTTDRSPAKIHADHEVLAAKAVNVAPAIEGVPQWDKRMLAPPTRSQIAAPGERPTGSKKRTKLVAMPNVESFTTAGAGLAIVIGLFLVCMWLLRRSGPKPTSPLPKEAVAVLGRVPLAARNFAHLLQVGNKLVLVAITPDGVSPITEVTDPAEVQRLLGMCLRDQKHSTTAEFHNVLEQLSKEPASGFLGNQVAASYASQRR